MRRTRRNYLKRGAVALGAWTLRASAFGVSKDLSGDAKQVLLALSSPALEPFLADWPFAAAAHRTVEPSGVPVLRYLPDLASRAPAFSSTFVRAVLTLSPQLAWRQSYTKTQVGEPFLENYGWTEIMGLTGETVSEHLACGVLLLGPRTAYPPHRHEAEEIYVPLSGRALWQRGGGPFRVEAEGAVIHHASFEPHAMRTEAVPLLALYLWRSRNLSQKAQLIPTGE